RLDYKFDDRTRQHECAISPASAPIDETAAPRGYPGHRGWRLIDRTGCNNEPRKLQQHIESAWRRIQQQSWRRGQLQRRVRRQFPLQLRADELWRQGLSAT